MVLVEVEVKQSCSQCSDSSQLVSMYEYAMPHDNLQQMKLLDLVYNNPSYKPYKRPF